ncbi:MAG: hypothetical protein ABW046_05245 [Actinoplanes sp.]
MPRSNGGEGGEGGNWFHGLFSSPTHLSQALGSTGILTVSIFLSAVLIGLVTVSIGR